MIITQTPLRISFAGGGTDLHQYYHLRDGLVVSTAIDKFVFVIVSSRYDDKIYVNYSRKEIVDSVDEIQHDLVREAMRVAGVSSGVEVTLLSDIPSEGSGLGSSSSFTVGLLNALHLHQSEQVGPSQLAEEACGVEVHRCKKPIGKQDQYIAAFGGLAAFSFKKDESVAVEQIRLSDAELRALGSNLFLFYSSSTRQSSTILVEQARKTHENLGRLDKIAGLAAEAREALRNHQFDRLGAVLDRNWRLKRELASQISNSRLDQMHTAAMQAGATGAKVCGAGGGGFLLVCCPAHAHERLLSAMADYRRMPFSLERDGSKVIFNYRRPSWK